MVRLGLGNGKERIDLELCVLRCSLHYSHHTTMGGYFSRWWFGTEEDFTDDRDEVDTPPESHTQEDLAELHLKADPSRKSHLQLQGKTLQGAVGTMSGSTNFVVCQFS